MSLSPAVWRLAGSAAAHQLWTLVGNTGDRKVPTRPTPLALLGFADGTDKLVRLVDADDPAAAAKKAAADVAADFYVLAADAQLAASQDALMLLLHEGELEAQLALAYKIPFRVIATIGMPDDPASREAMRQAIRDSDAYQAIKDAIGPVMTDADPDADDAVVIPQNAPTTAQFGEFRVRFGIVERLKDDGTPKVRIPLGPDVSATLVRERQVGIGIGFLLFAGASLAAAFFCGGYWGLACVALPALLLGFIGAYGLFRKRYLRIGHGDEVERWLCQHDFEDPDLLAFVAMVNADPGPPTDRAVPPLSAPAIVAPPPKAAPPRPDAIARRAMTEATLLSDGLRQVPVPPILAADQVQLRPAAQVAERALALAMIVGPLASGAGMSAPIPDRAFLQERFGPLMNALSPDEQAFLDAPTAEMGHVLSWRLEAAATLLWAVGWLRGPLSYHKQIDGDAVMAAIRAQGDVLSTAVAGATLRDTDQILDLLDQVYCRRWITVDARINGAEPPASLQPGILLERHYALNWLTSFNNAQGVEWDEVECPT